MNSLHRTRAVRPPALTLVLTLLLVSPATAIALDAEPPPDSRGVTTPVPTPPEKESARLAAVLVRFAGDLRRAADPRQGSAFERLSADDLFVLEAIGALSRRADAADGTSDVPAEIRESCGVKELGPFSLSSSACARAVFAEERREWRRGAFIAVRAHDRALRTFLEFDNDPTDARDRWWREAGTGALEALARVGREWMKRREGANGEGASPATAESVASALDRLLGEPSVQQLPDALGKLTPTPELTAMKEIVTTLLARGARADDSLVQAERFAANYAGAISTVFGRELNVVRRDGTCTNLVIDAPPGLFDGEEACVATMRLLSGAHDDRWRAEVVDAVDPIAALAETFTSRAESLRLLVGLLHRVPLEIESCFAALSSISGSNGPLDGQSWDGPLDDGSLEDAADGAARLMSACRVRSLQLVMQRLCAVEATDHPLMPREVLDTLRAKLEEAIGESVLSLCASLDEVVLGADASPPDRLVMALRASGVDPALAFAALDDNADLLLRASSLGVGADVPLTKTVAAVSVCRVLNERRADALAIADEVFSPTALLESLVAVALELPTPSTDARERGVPTLATVCGMLVDLIDESGHLSHSRESLADALAAKIKTLSAAEVVGVDTEALSEEALERLHTLATSLLDVSAGAVERVASLAARADRALRLVALPKWSPEGWATCTVPGRVGFNVSTSSPRLRLEHDGEEARVRLDAAVSVSLCGLSFDRRGGDSTGGSRADIGPVGAHITIARADTDLSLLVPLEGPADGSDVERGLHAELQNRLKGLSATIDLDAVRHALARLGLDPLLLRVIASAIGTMEEGVDLASRGVSATFSIEEGLRIESELRIGSLSDRSTGTPVAPFPLCLRVPVRADEPPGRDEDCLSPARLGEARERLAAVILSRLETVLAERFGLSPAGAKTALAERLVTIGEPGEAPSLTLTSEGNLRLRVRGRALGRHFGELDGSLVVEVPVRDTAARGGEIALPEVIEWPTLDVESLLAERFKVFRAAAGEPSIFVLTELPAPSVAGEPVRQTGWTRRVTGQCTVASAVSREPRYLPTARVSFGPDAPLVGVLGTICISPTEGSALRFVPPPLGSAGIATRDGQWHFSFVAPDDGDPVDNAELRVALEATGTRAPFDSITDSSIELALDLMTGDWRIPHDSARNDLFYRAIERDAASLLPPGVRFRDLHIGSEGIEFSLDGDEASERLIDTVLESVPPERWAQANAVTCDLKTLAGLVGMLESGRAGPVQSSCDEPTPSDVDPDGLSGDLTVGRAARLVWSCTKTSAATNELRECVLSLPNVEADCDGGSSVSMKVRWSDGAPSLHSKVLSRCLERYARSRLSDLPLPDGIADALSFDVPRLTDAARCASRPASCGVLLPLRLDVSSLGGRFEGVSPGGVSDCDAIGPEGVVAGQVFLGFDGAVRVQDGQAGASVRALGDGLRRCLARVSLAMLQNELEGPLEARLDKAALAFAERLERLRDASGAEHCSFRRLDRDDDIACADRDAVTGALLTDGTLKAIEIVRTVDVFGQPVELALELEWAAAVPNVRRLVDDDLDPEDELMSLVESFSLRPRCSGDVVRNCADVLVKTAERVAGGMATLLGKSLRYESGATLVLEDRTLSFVAPLVLDIEPLDLSTPIIVRCEMTLDIGKKTWGDCDGTTSGFRLALLQSLEGPMEDVLAGVNLSVGLLDLAFAREDAVRVDPIRESLIIEGLLGVTLLSVDVPITIEVPLCAAGSTRRCNIKLEASYETLERLLLSGAKSLIDDFTGELFGDLFELEIVSLKISERDRSGLPETFVIESQAEIDGLVTISAPAIEFGADGLRVTGPNHLTVGFPNMAEGLPIPPFVICPKSGRVSDKEIVLSADVTVGTCTAKNLVNYAGRLTIDLTKLGRLKTNGELVVLTVIPLGTDEGEIDLTVPMMRGRAEIGGVLSDIIALTADYELSGDPLTVSAEGDIRVFGASAGVGIFRLDVPSSTVHADIAIDLGFVQGSGKVETERGFSAPRLDAEASMRVGGVPLIGARLRARPRFVKAGLSVFGLRLVVVFPGIEALDESEIRRLIERLLTPNLENLDEALEALLQGNVTINPFADFGSGGEGFGNGDDSDDGGNPDGDEGGREEGGPNDPGNGLAQGAEPGAAIATPADLPPASPGGHLGTRVASITYRTDPATDRVSIESDIGDGAGARLVAVAESVDASASVRHFVGTKPAGRLLAVSRGVHAQLLDADNAESCASSAYSAVVHLNAGRENPRHGYYELCRLRLAGAKGPTPATEAALAALPAPRKRDLTLLHEAIGARLVANAQAEDRRVLLGARAFDDIEGVSGIVAVVRPGLALAVASARVDAGRNSVCGSTTVTNPDVSHSASRLFVLRGVDATDLDDPASVAGAIRALWGCEGIPDARLRADWLASTSTLSERRGNEITKVDTLENAAGGQDGRNDVPLSDELSSLAAAQAAEQAADAEREVLEAALKAGVVSSDVRLVCLSDCRAAEDWTIAVDTDDAGVCVISREGVPSGRFARDVHTLPDTECELPAPLVILSSVKGSYVGALIGQPEGAPPELRLLLMRPNDEARTTGSLAFAPGESMRIDDLDAEVLRVLSLFASASSTWSDADLDVPNAALVHAPNATVALMVGLGEEEQRWFLAGSGTAAVELPVRTNGALDEEERAALLGLLPPDPRGLRVLKNRTGAVVREAAASRLLRREDNGRWHAVARMRLGTDSTLPTKIVDHLLGTTSGPAATAPVPEGRVLSGELGSGADAAYALGMEDGSVHLWRHAPPLNATAADAPIPAAVALDREGTLAGAPHAFSLSTEPGKQYRVVVMDSGASGLDPFVCLYDDAGSYVDHDDDIGADNMENYRNTSYADQVENFSASLVLPGDRGTAFKIIVGQYSSKDEAFAGRRHDGKYRLIVEESNGSFPLDEDMNRERTKNEVRKIACGSSEDAAIAQASFEWLNHVVANGEKDIAESGFLERVATGLADRPDGTNRLVEGGGKRFLVVASDEGGGDEWLDVEGPGGASSIAVVVGDPVPQKLVEQSFAALLAFRAREDAPFRLVGSTESVRIDANDVTDVWVASERDDDTATLFHETKGEVRRVTVSGAAIDTEPAERAIRYAIAQRSDAVRVLDVESDRGTLLLVRETGCSTGRATCADDIVLIDDAGAELAVASFGRGSELIEDRSVVSRAAAWFDLTTRTAPDDAIVTRFDGIWHTDLDATVLRFHSDGSYLVTRGDGTVACLDTDGAVLSSTWLNGLAVRWPEPTHDPRGVPRDALAAEVERCSEALGARFRLVRAGVDKFLIRNGGGSDPFRFALLDRDRLRESDSPIVLEGTKAGLGTELADAMERAIADVARSANRIEIVAESVDPAPHVEGGWVLAAIDSTSSNDGESRSIVERWMLGYRLDTKGEVASGEGDRVCVVRDVTVELTLAPDDEVESARADAVGELLATLTPASGVVARCRPALKRTLYVAPNDNGEGSDIERSWRTWLRIGSAGDLAVPENEDHGFRVRVALFDGEESGIRTDIPTSMAGEEARPAFVIIRRLDGIGRSIELDRRIANDESQRGRFLTAASRWSDAVPDDPLDAEITTGSTAPLRFECITVDCSAETVLAELSSTRLVAIAVGSKACSGIAAITHVSLVTGVSGMTDELADATRAVALRGREAHTGTCDGTPLHLRIHPVSGGRYVVVETMTDTVHGVEHDNAWEKLGTLPENTPDAARTALLEAVAARWAPFRAFALAPNVPESLIAIGFPGDPGERAEWLTLAPSGRPGPPVVARGDVLLSHGVLADHLLSRLADRQGAAPRQWIEFADDILVALTLTNDTGIGEPDIDFGPSHIAVRNVADPETVQFEMDGVASARSCAVRSDALGALIPALVAVLREEQDLSESVVTLAPCGSDEAEHSEWLTLGVAGRPTRWGSDGDSSPELRWRDFDPDGAAAFWSNVARDLARLANEGAIDDANLVDLYAGDEVESRFVVMNPHAGVKAPAYVTNDDGIRRIGVFGHVDDEWVFQGVALLGWLDEQGTSNGSFAGAPFPIASGQASGDAWLAIALERTEGQSSPSVAIADANGLVTKAVDLGESNSSSVFTAEGGYPDGVVESYDVAVPTALRQMGKLASPEGVSVEPIDQISFLATRDRVFAQSSSNGKLSATSWTSLDGSRSDGLEPESWFGDASIEYSPPVLLLLSKALDEGDQPTAVGVSPAGERLVVCTSATDQGVRRTHIRFGLDVRRIRTPRGIGPDVCSGWIDGSNDAIDAAFAIEGTSTVLVLDTTATHTLVWPEPEVRPNDTPNPSRETAVLFRVTNGTAREICPGFLGTHPAAVTAARWIAADDAPCKFVVEGGEGSGEGRLLVSTADRARLFDGKGAARAVQQLGKPDDAGGPEDKAAAKGIVDWASSRTCDETVRWHRTGEYLYVEDPCRGIGRQRSSARMVGVVDYDERHTPTPDASTVLALLERLQVEDIEVRRLRATPFGSSGLAITSMEGGVESPEHGTDVAFALIRGRECTAAFVSAPSDHSTLASAGGSVDGVFGDEHVVFVAARDLDEDLITAMISATPPAAKTSSDVNLPTCSDALSGVSSSMVPAAASAVAVARHLVRFSPEDGPVEVDSNALWRSFNELDADDVTDLNVYRTLLADFVKGESAVTEGLRLQLAMASSRGRIWRERDGKYRYLIADDAHVSHSLYREHNCRRLSRPLFENMLSSLQERSACGRACDDSVAAMAMIDLGKPFWFTEFGLVDDPRLRLNTASGECGV